MMKISTKKWHNCMLCANEFGWPVKLKYYFCFFWGGALCIDVNRGAALGSKSVTTLKN
jgi:hypothetical protein